MIPIPQLPDSLDVLARTALLLIAAVALAEVGQRRLGLPRVTGYVLAGVLMGPGVLQWVPLSISGELRPFMLLGLGLLLFELGSRVDLRWLKANPWLLATSVGEAALTFVGAYVFLKLAGMSTAIAFTVAAIAVSSSPTVVMRVVSETGARGQMTQRLLLLSALNSLYAILLLKFGYALIHLDQGGDPLRAIAHPLYQASGSFLLAVVVAFAMHLAQSAGLRRESERFAIVIAILLLASNAADLLGLSVPMVLLVAGMLLRTRSGRLVLFPEHFGAAGALLVVLLFVLTGLAISPAQVAAGGGLALGLLVVRAGAKWLGAWWSAGRGGLAPRKAGWLGVALLPMSSLAVLQAYEVAGLYPPIDAAAPAAADTVSRTAEALATTAASAEVLAIVLGAVAVMEIAGPILTQVALRRAGEAAPAARTETTSRA